MIQGFFQSDVKRPEILSLLIFPIAAMLFGTLSGACGSLFLKSIQTLLSNDQLRSLTGLVCICLLVLLIAHLFKTYKIFGRKMGLVLAAALVFSPLSLLFAQRGIFLAAWLAELLFLLYAAQTSLQIFLLPPDRRYKNASLGTLLFLILIGALEIIHQTLNSGWKQIIPYGVLMVLYLALQVFGFWKQRSIQMMQIAMDNSAMAGNLKLALGPEGIRQLLPYFRTQMSEGSSVARLLILDITRGIDFDGKEDLAKTAFNSGQLEVQFAVIDQIFDWLLPYSLLVYVVNNCADSLAEYMVRKIFVNYPDITNHGVAEELQKSAKSLGRFPLSEESKKMFSYVVFDERKEYSQILNGLLMSGRKEDRLFAVEIMAAYIGHEDETNKKFLVEIIENTFHNPTELEEMIELCAEYDSDLEYLRNHLSIYYSIGFLRKLCEYYEPLAIAKSFAATNFPVPIALTLLAANRLDNKGKEMYGEKVNQLNDYISRLDKEERKIRSANVYGSKLLLDEIQRLKLTLTNAVCEYNYGFQIENSLEMISHDRDLEGEFHIKNREESHLEINSEKGSFNYDVLRVSTDNALLESIYRYLGGEAMDTRLTENIEKLISLKSIPMFSDLDVFTLQQIQKISVYKKISVGETIIVEGEEGTNLYIVITGKVGVFKGGILINEIGKGGLFGEMAIIEKQRRSATIMTIEDTNFLIIEGDDFVKLLERNSSISMSVIKTLTGRLRKMLEEGK